MEVGRRLPRYLVVGAAGTAVHYLVFGLCLRHTAAGAAALAGSACGMAISYAGNRCWTFESTRAHSDAIPAFVLTSLAMALLNAAIVAALAAALGPWPAQIFATAVTTFAGFAAHRHWSFR